MKIPALGLAAAILVAAPGAALAQSKLKNERSAMGSLKVINSSQALFREGDKDRNNTLDYADSLAALGKVDLIGEDLASGTHRGYRFKVTRSKKTPEFLWMATASPLKPGVTGDRYFAINHRGVTYHALKPFAHTDDCKLKGIPTSSPLPGWKPRYEGLAKIFHEANTSGALRRIPAQRYFAVGEPKGNLRVVELRSRINKWGVRLELIRFKLGGKLEAEFHRLDSLGEFEAMDYIQTVILKRPTLRLSGRLSGGAIALRNREAKSTLEVDWRPGTLPISLVLYVLPCLYDRIPPTMSFPLLIGTKILAGGSLDRTVKAAPRPGATAAEKTIAIKHPVLGEATVWVSTAEKERGKILALKPFGGELLRACDKPQADAAILASVGPDVRKEILRRRLQGNERSARWTMSTIARAQRNFAMRDSDKNGVRDFAVSLAVLGKFKLISAELAKGVQNGYRFKLTRSKKGPTRYWMATASPVTPGKTGIRHFGVNHLGGSRHSLKPFAHNEDCKLEGGVPTWKTLPGYKPPR